MMILTLLDVREEFYQNVFNVGSSPSVINGKAFIRPHTIQRLQTQL